MNIILDKDNFWESEFFGSETLSNTIELLYDFDKHRKSKIINNDCLEV